MALKEFRMYASEKPSESETSPQVYVSTVFAKNEVVARSRLFRLLRIKHKLKSSQGEVLKAVEVPQHGDMKIRNFGVTAVYRSSSGLHNFYKEFRAPTRAIAVERIYQDIGSRHHVPSQRVTVVDVVEVPDDEVASKDLLQIVKSPKYPLFDKRVPATHAKFRAVPVNY